MPLAIFFSLEVALRPLTNFLRCPACCLAVAEAVLAIFLTSPFAFPTAALWRSTPLLTAPRILSPKPGFEIGFRG